MNKRHSDTRMTTIARLWRQYVPARISELLALVSVATTLLLCIHTSNLQSQLHLYSQQINELTATYDVGRGDKNQLPLSSASLQRSHSLQKPSHSSDSAKVEAMKYKTMYKIYKREDFGKLDVEKLNKTRRHAKFTLMFNRVPKVGSQSTMELMRALSYRNGFTFHKDRPQKVENIKMTEREARRLVQLVDVFRPPAVYVKHVCYIDFTKYNISQPIYINMVRDPVERVISWYYYVRAPWYFVERKQAFPELPLPSSAWLRKDYETCVLSGDKECRYELGDERPDFAQLTEFFCGQDRKCTGFNTEYALQKAKENVEKEYAVVGVLEDINVTLTVFEKYIPKFFIGAKDLYWNEIQKFSKVNRNIYKPSVPENIKEIVRKNFTRELEFYEFCRQRLYKQYIALNLPLS